MQYQVRVLSEDPPKEWKSPAGNVVYYIEVMVEGHDKPISVGKKSPDALKVGDTIWGDIIPTEFPVDKFKPSAPPQGVSASKPVGDSKFLKDTSDTPLRVFTAGLPYIDTVNLMKDENYRREYLEFVRDTSEELIKMMENIRDNS